MRLTAILLLCGSFTVSANSNAQRITLTEKNAPLTQLFKEIQRQSGYDFVYTYELISEAGNATVQLRNATVNEALEQCLAGKNLNYLIKDRTIVIQEKQLTHKDQVAVSELLPPIDVRGRIVDENGEPVLATVQVKGTTKGIATKPDGTFELRSVEENSTLVISGVSIETLEISLNGRTDIGSIRARLKITALGEIVINKGYYTEKQKLSTGNVGRVTAKEIERQPVLNPLAAMQGRIAGVDITQQSGTPGGGFSIKIRGTNSIASGNSPLFILDGVPYNGDMNGASAVSGNLFRLGGISALNFINPYDIESIEVLKDADATAIYGSRGANGVVLITTKRPKGGKTTATFNISHGISQLGHKMKLMNKDQYLQYRAMAFRNAGTLPTANDFDVNGAWANNSEIDWVDKVVGGNGQYSDMQLSFSGGSENTQFTVNGAWHKETTVHPGHYPWDRKSVHFSGVSTSNDKRFNMHVSGNFTSSGGRMPYTDLINLTYAYPNAPEPLLENGKLNWSTDWQNPYSYLEVKNFTSSTNLFGSAVLSYKILKGISARLTASYNHFEYNDNQGTPTSYYRPSLNITAARSNFAFNTINTFNVEPQLNYDTKIGKGNFSALAGATVQEIKNDSYALNASGYTDNNLLTSLAGAATIDKGQITKTQYRYRGLYVRLNYNLYDKYVVNLTGRSDGSSRFAPNYRFRSFAAAGAAWIFSNEEFFKKSLPFVSYGKLRGSYGITGNDQFADYRYLDLYSYTTYSALYQATQGLIPGNLYNPDLVWEENKKLEAALELGFLKNRVNLSASWYRNRSGNQIVQTPLPATTGFTTVWANLPALVQNTGWEFTFNSLNIDNKDFRWRTTFNITDQQNKLISFPDLQKTNYRSQYEIGKSLTGSKVLKYMGVDPLVGLYTFRTATGAITFAPNASFDADRNYFVDQTPNFNGGFGNNFTYKAFELDVFFTFSKKWGSNPLFYNIQTLGYFNRLNYFNTMPEVLNAWQKPGDISNIQRVSSILAAENNTYANAIASDYNIVDASYIKLKNVSLSWLITEKMRKKLHLQNGRVYLQAQNLFTITRFKGWDPEPAGDGPFMPPLRIITAGVQFTF